MDMELTPILHKVRSLPTDIRDDRRRQTLLVVAAGWFLSLGIRLVFPVFIPQVVAEFEIGYDTAGVLLSLLWVGYALLQFPGGIVADRIGERNVLVISNSITILGLSGIAFAPSFLMMALATCLVGIGLGFYGTTGITVLSNTFPERSDVAISISQATGSVGTATLPVISGFVAFYLGWRVGFAYLIPLFIVTAVGLWMVVPKSSSSVVENADHSVIDQILAIKKTLFNWDILLITTSFFCMLFVYQGATGFLPTYLVEVKGIQQDTSTLLFGLFFTTGMLAQVSSGVLSERFGRLVMLISFAAVSVPAYLLLPLIDDTMAIVPIIILASAILGFGPLAQAHLVDGLQDEFQGSIFGFVRTLAFGCSTVSPVIIGWLAQSGRFALAFRLLGTIACLASALVVLLLIKTRAGATREYILD
ncbi:MFS transporter [Natrinema halophilum]|uniref:MFS transporter n=1 Tax=Natrinema halophilum TaxID=1699371 RepID=UPI001F1F9E8D|nr:MFS transporter [Natrinema halophilum]UHQ96288.1 MFS transporter [Natrinema halophilum]